MGRSSTLSLFRYVIVILAVAPDYTHFYMRAYIYIYIVNMIHLS